MAATITFETDPSDRSRPMILAIGDRMHPEWMPDAHWELADRDRAVAALARLSPDLILVDVDSWSAGLAAAIAAPADRDCDLVLVADDTQADAVGVLLGHRIDGFLDPVGDRFAGRQMLESLCRRHAGVDGVSDIGIGSAIPGQLELLRRDAERVALALAELAASRSADAPVPRPVTAARIRAHIKARRLRERFFGPDLFADPAWDMLLDLAAARMEGRPVSVSSLCIAAAVPTTTALRWIKTMIDRGLFVRAADPEDARRAFIGLEAGAAVALDNCLDAMLNHPGQ